MRYSTESTDYKIVQEVYAQIMDTMREGRVTTRNAMAALELCFQEIEDAFLTEVPSWSLNDYDYRKSAIIGPDD